MADNAPHRSLDAMLELADDERKRQREEPTYRDGEPCAHPGCLNHRSHPCDGCGRIGGVFRGTPEET